MIWAYRLVLDLRPEMIGVIMIAVMLLAIFVGFPYFVHLDFSWRLFSGLGDLAPN